MFEPLSHDLLLGLIAPMARVATPAFGGDADRAEDFARNLLQGLQDGEVPDCLACVHDVLAYRSGVSPSRPGRLERRLVALYVDAIWRGRGRPPEPHEWNLSLVEAGLSPAEAVGTHRPTRWSKGA